jgi:hypothetical protein
MGDAHLRVCVYGRSGAGKTGLGVTAPRPLILLGERQGYSTILARAAALEVPVPPVVLFESIGDVSAVLRILRESPADSLEVLHGHLASLERERGNADPRPFGVRDAADLPYSAPASVVFDSATEVTRVLMERIEATATLTVGRDGLPSKDVRFITYYKEQADRLFRSLRDVPAHVLILARMVDRDSDAGRYQGPDLTYATLGEALSSTVQATGVLRASQERIDRKDRDSPKRTIRTVEFAGPEYVLTKGVEGLKPTEAPDFAAWVMQWQHARAELQ